MFLNLCSWNANSLIMYSRFTVTAQRHTEREGHRNISVILELKLTRKTQSDYFLLYGNPSLVGLML